MKIFQIVVIATCCVFLAAMARADDHASLELDDLRIRAVHGSVKVTAGFVTIRNNGSDDDRLISISTEFAGKNELHTMAVENGVMKMRALKDGIEIPAGGEVMLKPGGLHMMFMKLSDMPKMGETRMITFVFEKAGTITLSADVKMVKHSH